MKRTGIFLAILIGCTGVARTQSIKEINAPTVKDLDQVTEFHEGLAAVRKGSQWGFIDQAGKLVIEFRDDLPRNPNGKLLKRELRKPYWPT